jgi:hypothetical protein
MAILLVQGSAGEQPDSLDRFWIALDRNLPVVAPWLEIEWTRKPSDEAHVRLRSVRTKKQRAWIDVFVHESEAEVIRILKTGMSAYLGHTSPPPEAIGDECYYFLDADSGAEVRFRRGRYLASVSVAEADDAVPLARMVDDALKSAP